MSIISHIRTYRDIYLILFSILASVLLIQGAAFAASTISTNISTDGTLTVNGNSTFGNAATDINLFTGTLQASTTALLTSGFTTFGNWTIDQAATTTVTFNQTGINFDSNTLVISPTANRIGILTANPANALDVSGTLSATSVGVASTSPHVALGVVGTTTSSAGVRVGADGSGITQILFGTCTYNPGAAVTASTTRSTNCTGATGVRSGDRVFVTPRTLEQHLIMVSASSTANDVIQVTVYNTGINGGNITPASATWDWLSIR